MFPPVLVGWSPHERLLDRPHKSTAQHRVAYPHPQSRQTGTYLSQKTPTVPVHASGGWRVESV